MSGTASKLQIDRIVRARQAKVVWLAAIQVALFGVAVTLVAQSHSTYLLIIPTALSVIATFAIGRSLSEQLEATVAKANVDLEKQTIALAQERGELATLMSAISDGILAVGLDSRPLFYNSSLALLFLDRSLEQRRPTLTEVFRNPSVLEAYSKVLQDGKNTETQCTLAVRNSNHERFFSISVSALRNTEGRVYGAVGIFHDVTELKKAEQIRMEFVANVSHELRTPLTAIKGYTDTLIEDSKKNEFESAGKFLGIVARNVDRLMKLIEDLLTISHLESGEENEEGLVLQPVNTRELTERVLVSLDAVRKAKHHEVTTQISASHVYADAARVEQVLVNLLENAIKYVPSGGKIRVEWVTTQEPTGVALIVADNGPGIPAEALPRLFERFFRVDKARSRELGGTGLGLAIVKHILQRHGGTVSVTSSPGKGTEFRCQFPG